MPYNYGSYNPAYAPYTGQSNQNYYGTRYPNDYQTAMPMQPVQPVQQPMQQLQQGFVWVQGEAGAKAYPVAAGGSVLLMDSEAPVLYMKSTDVNGRPLPIETYDLVKRVDVVQEPPKQISAKEIDLSEYAKRSDIEELVKEYVNKALES